MSATENQKTFNILSMSVHVSTETGGVELFFRSAEQMNDVLKTPCVQDMFETQRGEDLALSLRGVLSAYMESLVRFDAENRPNSHVFEGQALPALEEFDTQGRCVKAVFIREGQIVSEKTLKPRR